MIGMRLYVRGNCRRFLAALINELTNWLSATRVKSAKLLKLIVTLCEEHLTMEIHTLLPSFIKALKLAREDSEKELYFILLEVYELLGRYDRFFSFSIFFIYFYFIFLVFHYFFL